ncbi:hypothetical protein [Halorubrum salipaludis]|uniref:hypothetical protein n=1 Tax=Halorubrum salipaludis TaxID=2032630 RepID=UPI001181B181|nr:hypothetical protein [Halorubrum salipaludis]
MVNVAAIVGPILGGLISGLVGLGIEEYRHKKSEEREIRSWFDTTIRLTERIDNSQPLTMTQQARKEQAPIIRSTCAGVQANLSNHLAEAPLSVSEDLVADCEKLVGDCQTVKEYSIGRSIPNGFFDDARDARDQAETVKEKAEKERENL